MNLNLGCGEIIKGWECFSSIEIIYLKGLPELVCYRGVAPNPLQCPFGLALPIFEHVYIYIP